MERDALHTGVLVAGAGPAGLAAAIAARQKGFRVTVADAGHPPIDKACGEGLMPEGVRALGQLGISIASQKSSPLRGIRFLGNETAVEAAFPGGNGFGVRRTTLYRALMERALAAGVSILWGAPVRAFPGEPILVGGKPAQYTWLIGADGLHSQVRRWAGLDERRQKPARFGFRRHFCVEPWTRHVEVHWGPDCQLFITPVNGEEVCVALLSRNPHPRLADALPLFPEVAARLVRANATSVERGSVSASRRLRAVTRNRVALVGDASGSADAITGQGLCLAFQQAVALGDAIARENLPLYQTAHRSITKMPALMGRLMLAMDRHPLLQRRVLGCLAARPGLFSRLLALHLGAPSEVKPVSLRGASFS